MRPHGRLTHSQMPGHLTGVIIQVARATSLFCDQRLFVHAFQPERLEAHMDSKLGYPSFFSETQPVITMPLTMTKKVFVDTLAMSQVGHGSFLSSALGKGDVYLATLTPDPYKNTTAACSYRCMYCVVKPGELTVINGIYTWYYCIASFGGQHTKNSIYSPSNASISHVTPETRRHGKERFNSTCRP